MRVKICGITTPEDGLLALDAGAHALGLVFYAPSPRAVSVEAACAVAEAVGPLVTLVGLFVDAKPDEVNTVLQSVPLQLLQLHGNETPAYCEAFGRPYIKALRMKHDLDVEKAMAAYPGASGFLLDAYRKGVPGGTGETFDWERVPRQTQRPVILAGGLTPANVAGAIATVRPYGVDVSGGVEEEPGRKAAHKVQQFVANAQKGIQGEQR